MKLVLIGGGDSGTVPGKPYNLKEIDEKKQAQGQKIEG